MSEFVGEARASYPYSAVCYIIAAFEDGTMNAATGFMVGPNDVLTVSHAIYNDDYGGLAETITVYPAHDGGDSPYGEHIAASIEYLIADSDGDGLMTRQESENDVAVLGLDSRVGDTVGLFGLDPDATGSAFEFTGYPSTYRVDGEARMVTDTGSVKTDPWYTVYSYISIETQPGSSGSPLWYTAADGTATAVGIGSTSEWAVSIAAQYDRITEWIADNDGLIPAASPPDMIGETSGDTSGGDTPQETPGAGTSPTDLDLPPLTRPSQIGAAFDAAWYTAGNPDVATAGVDALAHYLAFGWREGRDPNAWFDSDGYLAAYADVAQAGLDPLTHYQLYGWIEGRDPSARFDTLAYLSANPDVIGFGDGALAHFIQFGADEGRSAIASDDPAWQGIA